MEPTKTRRPTRIGQYEILQTLGTGSFGKVKRKLEIIIIS